ncbi:MULTISPECIES: hypothetical protein [unclassified Mycolicibacterium]|uniref:hypothetical protein n=1 Tax=unclassified Mycolicibacterium TaxID=2636767 RepID=UPI001307B0A5|nr:MULTISPECIES: hypothetical protein [unclassified Mycolicibacterium]MUL83145.1 hypothetical protein [Mycolicibacterium sp. CBMA 329]MUL89480.1 hypothetical protein [Mycolicibacterium sp. CBMA 331]MUL99168.1 hypothetical protein [Mycolicibacterium sp. CBMA 334]MUM25730.1 hypothetical protein [Mycolicibacterium sp. CBMA 295]MUM38996.1 hypothetical protein [Mycolicibacterium sp. CBMA 247]
MTSGSTAVLAHGLGGSTDLPIPYTFALIGAAWTLTFTFAVVALAWRRPRFDPDKPGVALPSWVTTAVDSPVTRWILGLLALAFTGWVVFTAFTRPPAANPLPGVFYVLLWVGLVAASVLFGPVWRLISPVRTLCRFVPVRDRWHYPERIGYWPAAAGLFAFVWLELASLDPGSVVAIRNWLLVYFVVTFAGALCCGQRWLESADPFEVYSTVVSRLSPLRRHGGRIVLGNPFDHLPSLPVRPGLVALLAVLLGSTAFDSFSAMPQWRNFVDAHSGSALGASLIRTAGLLVFATTVAVTFWTATRTTGGVDRRLRRELPGLMAHSLIPIVVGYVFAHYLSYLVERGQQTVILLFGLRDVRVSYFLSAHPAVLASLKVGCVLAGHVAGVIAAHDRALFLLPKQHQLTGQLATMLVMVGYTFTGLYLLFGG